MAYDIFNEETVLQLGGGDCVLCTRSCLLDTCVLSAQGFSLKTLKHLVLDEADRLLNMDFEQEIDQILKVVLSPCSITQCSSACAACYGACVHHDGLYEVGTCFDCL